MDMHDGEVIKLKRNFQSDPFLGGVFNVFVKRRQHRRGPGGGEALGRDSEITGSLFDGGGSPRSTGKIDANGPPFRNAEGNFKTPGLSFFNPA